MLGLEWMDINIYIWLSFKQISPYVQKYQTQRVGTFSLTYKKSAISS